MEKNSHTILIVRTLKDKRTFVVSSNQMVEFMKYLQQEGYNPPPSVPFDPNTGKGGYSVEKLGDAAEITSSSVEPVDIQNHAN